MEKIRSLKCCQITTTDPAASIELLDSTIFALDIRCRAISYQCKEHLLKAKQFNNEKDAVRCRSELQRRHQLQQTYSRYVNLYNNVRRVRDSLDEASAVGTIATNMSVANHALEEALKSVDPEKIQALMTSLEEGTYEMHEVSSILGENRGTEDFDEEAAMRELEESEPLSLPIIKKEQNRILIPELI